MMHIQVVNFRLDGMSVSDFERLCDELAPAFGAIPGLISKLWLADPARGVFGGVYTWEDRAAMEAFARSDLFRSVATHPSFAELTSRDFAILEQPTRITRGFAAVPA